MNAWNLLEALTELDNDLILMPKPRKKPEIRQIRRIALIAALMMLLIGMVFAVSIGVSVQYGEEMIQLQGVSFDGNAQGNQTYYTAKVEYELKQVCVQNLPWLTQKLTKEWEMYEHEQSNFYSIDLMTDDGNLLSFASISEAEKFFGIDLMQSAELNEFVRGVYASLVVADAERAETEYAKDKTITPDALLLYVSLRRGEAPEGMFDMQAVSECGITIFIALREDFAEHENVKCLYSHEKEGAFQESGMLTQHDDSILLLENSPQEDYAQTGYAAWCDKGIGYLAHIKVYPHSYATPLTLLTPILSRIN